MPNPGYHNQIAPNKCVRNAELDGGDALLRAVEQPRKKVAARCCCAGLLRGFAVFVAWETVHLRCLEGHLALLGGQCNLCLVGVEVLNVDLLGCLLGRRLLVQLIEALH